MSDSGNTDLLARMEKIERENRLLKRCITVVILAIGTIVMMAQAPARPRALQRREKVIIRYPNGKEAIVLGTSKNNVEGDAAHADFYSI